MGAGMPNIPTEAILDVAKSTMTTFTPYYIKGYAAELVRQLKLEAEATPSPYQLLDYELPKEPLKTGMLTKQGAIRKSWKDRYFVIYNAADNYIVHYYTDKAAFDAQPDKPKGCVLFSHDSFIITSMSPCHRAHRGLQACCSFTHAFPRATVL